jgi:hypothetical protein
MLALAGCGADSGERSASSTPSDGSAPSDDSALSDVSAPEQRDGSTGAQRNALTISPRLYAAGSARVRVSGFFSADGVVELNRPASITDEDQTWIQYGVSGARELNALFTNSTAMAENGMTIGVTSYSVTATSTSGECRTKFDVTDTSVSGHYVCTGSTGYDNKTGTMGKVDLDVEFDARSSK